MYKECKRPKSSERQRALEQHLIQKLLQTRYEDLSINDLCEELAINRKTFYRYFTGKQGALMAIIDHTISELDDWFLQKYSQTDGSPKAYLEVFFQFWAEHKPFLQAIDHSDLWTILVERSIGYLADYAWPESRDATAAWSSQFRFLTEFLIAGSARILDQWCLSNFTDTPEQLAAIAAQDLTHALSYWEK